MKNIIFDFGGVLLEWNANNFYLPYFNNDANAMNNFYEETCIQILNKEIDRGVPFDIILNDLTIKFPHYAEPIMLWKKAWHKMIGEKINGSIRILYTLYHNGYNLYGLTNWSGETFPYVYYTYDFFHLFKDIVVSGRENLIKPDLAIYQLCLTRNKLNPQQSVFIDDNFENVLAAKKIGMQAIHFIDADQLHSELGKLGIKL